MEDLQGFVAPAFLETVGWQAGCSSAVNRPLRMRVGAMAEGDHWNLFSVQPLKEREVLTMMCYSFVRGSSNCVGC